jgi:uncharacterized membrane protein YfcA
MPVYFARTSDVARLPWSLVAIGTVGVVVGTLAGERVLGRVRPAVFRRTVATIVGLLGLSFLWRALL